MKRLIATATARLIAAPGEEKKQPTFQIAAYNGGTFKPEWIYTDRPVVIDLAGLRAAEPISVLLDHVHSWIVGQSTAVKIAAAAIDVEGIITGDYENPEDPAGKVVLHARNGFQWKASIGIDPDMGRVERVEAGAVVTVNGREFAGPLYVVRAGVMDEVSFLSVGADKTASAKIAASAAGGTDMDFHEWLKGKGFDPTNLNDTQRDSLLKAFQAESAALKAAAAQGDPGKKTGGTAAGGDGLDDVLAPVREKQRRREAVRASVRKWAERHPEQIEAIEASGRVAMAEDWTPERLELHLYQDLGTQPIDTRLRPGRDPTLTARVFEAGLCMAAKFPNIEKAFDAQTLEAASRKWRYGLGLGELLLTAAKSHGFDGLSYRDVGPLLRAAFPREAGLRAGGNASPMDLSGILSNVANKFIVRYFDSTDSAWRLLARIASVTDFKTITRYSLTGDFEYVQVAPGGEIKHASMGEVAYTNKADTYGRMFGIDRRDIINDDLSAFDQVAFRLGRGGALKLNEVFWTIFLNNSAFFTAARGNFDDGTDSAFSLAALEVAEAMFAEQTDPDGKPISVMPKVLAVPPRLKRSALRIMNSTEVRANPTAGASNTYATGNTFQGDFLIASSPYMAASRFTGYSALAWYLLADPNEMPVIEACFLNGVERPTVESAQADFDSLGVKIRGYFDFGVALQEYRGGVKMKGEA